MAGNPNDVESKINAIINAWQKAIDDGKITADKKFKGMTLADFTAKVQPSLDARAELAKLELSKTSLLAARDTADAVSADVAHNVVQGVVGDADFGDDCDLYEEMG